MTETFAEIVYDRLGHEVISGVYPLIHAGESMVFWRTPDNTVYCGMITSINLIHGRPTYRVDMVLKCPPFEEYGK